MKYVQKLVTFYVFSVPSKRGINLCIPIFTLMLPRNWSQWIVLCLHLFIVVYLIKKEPATLFHCKHCVWCTSIFREEGGKEHFQVVWCSCHIDGSDSYCASFLVFDKAHKAVMGESISLVSMVTRKILLNSKG